MKTFRNFASKHDFLIMIPWSMFLDIVLEWLSRHSLIEALKFVVQHPIPFLYNSFIIFVVYSVAILFRRRTFVRRIVSGLFVTLGIINCVLLLNRVSPFGFSDLSMIGDLFTMKDSKYFSAWEAILAIVGLAVFAFFLVRLFIKGKKFKSKTPFWARLILVAALWIALPLSGKFLQSSGLIESYFGNLAQGYLDNGYIYGFATSMLDRGMRRPLGYSSKAVQQVLSDTDTDKTTITGQTGVDDADKKTGPNVIVVLLESFFDPTEVNYLSFSEDPIPFIHSLMQNYTTGHLTVPVVGAGTSNTEFEMLTGMSVSFFGPGEIPQKTVLKARSVESFADDMKMQGYSTHVVHNNGGNFYSRANAFSKMGFDTFTAKENLDITDYTPLGSWPTDDILIGATKDAMDSTKNRDFVYTITVSTHGNYPGYKVIDNPAIKVTAKGKDESLQYKWEYYVNQVHTMDTWIKNYVEMLNSRGEDTLLVMFGDHLPTMGLTAGDMKENSIFKTNYITWNNFGLKKEDKDLTSYQLVSDELGRIGIHTGTMLQFNQQMMKENIEPGSIEYTNRLNMLQYDLLYGNRYAYNGVNLYPSSDLVMGIRDITVNQAYSFNGKVHIYGTGFTKWCKVYVNGEQVDTDYISGECLTINDSDIKSGDSIVVSQVGSNSTVFRSSNKFTYSSTEATDGNSTDDSAKDPSDNNTSVESESSDIIAPLTPETNEPAQ
ncbi:MAG: LTA synthase family protein [Lachnospiraceae bacterium]|nr:LTA synthase family protein [Lachnospiraceae bacterium]